MDFKVFSDRISYLIMVFNGVEATAAYLNQSPVDVLKWAATGIYNQPPVRMDYTYFLYKNPMFSPQWLENGEGDIFICGSLEDNIEVIKKREDKILMDERNRIIEDELKERMKALV